jgi:3-oxoadipate enol-lactonase
VSTVTIKSGARIGVLEAGGGAAIPIIFLHGVGSDKSVWARQIEHFGRDRRALAFDYPGYGESSFADGATRDDYAAAILSAMDALGIERAYVCGLSLGGVIAIAMHAAAADRCASLILADSFAVHPDGAGITERSLAASRAGSMRDFAEARADFLLAAPIDPAVRAEVVETMAAIDPAAYRLGVEAVWMADQRDRAAAIRVPTLVLCGTEDRPTPPALSAELAALVPGSRIAMIPGAGHLTNLERPAEFNQAVDDFLAEIEAGR